MTCKGFVLRARGILFCLANYKDCKEPCNGASHTQCCGNTIIMEITIWKGLHTGSCNPEGLGSSILHLPVLGIGNRTG